MRDTEIGAPQVRKTFDVLGVHVDAVQIPEVIATMEQWIRRGEATHFIAVTGMHGVMEAQADASVKRILNAADLVVPDGMSLVQVGRLRGRSLQRRVYGPELMEAFCQGTGGKYRHFLYGATPPVLSELAKTLTRRFGTVVVGTLSPPFRPLSPDEDIEAAAGILKARPDVVWVGISTPKQERWMYEHREQLRVPVLVGVGAAFDLLARAKPQAPLWVRERGLEWLFRLLVEPRRLWRRYLIRGPAFVYLVLREEFQRRYATIR